MTPIVPDGPVVMPGPSQAPIVPDGPIQVPGQVGALESIHRGALQGVTMGFSDEIAGAVRSLFGGKDYRREREKERSANTQASEQHPYLYGGAELAAGLATPIPGAGAVKAAGTGAKLLKAAGSAALAGGAAGLGSSTADLTKGDFHGAINDTVSNALLGGAIGLAGAGLGKAVSRAGEKADDLTIRALAGAESKSSGAAWQKTRRMVNNPETKAILREPVQVDLDGKQVTTSLEKAAGKEPTVIQEIVDTQASRINDEIRPIYARADAKNGGVDLADYLKHLDGEVAKTKSMPPAEAGVYRKAYEELRENAVEQWGQMQRIPSEAVRAEATALQKIGFRTVDPLNPGLQTEVKREIGNSVRNFVNDHVMQTLGGEDHGRLLSLNKRMNAWLGVGTVAAARAEKEAAGRLSGKGLIDELGGRGSMVASGLTAIATGSPLPLLAPLGAKALANRGPVVRAAARGASKIDARLKAVADAAAGGNPFAAQLLRTIQQTPGGIARVAALQGGQPPAAQPIDSPLPTEAPPDAILAQR